MSPSVSELSGLSKQGVFDAAGDGFIAQTGGELFEAHFALPHIDATIYGPLPSIETFVASPDGEISAMGTNAELTTAWMPAVERLVASVSGWAAAAGVTLAGDAYITASITLAPEVNGQAHFDDDQFVAAAGAGLVAIVGDLGGPRVASESIPHPEIAPPRPVIADNKMVAAFADGTIPSNTYGANELVVLPQFAQLHAGPGPCGRDDQVRHLLVYRAATAPTEI